MVTRIPGSAHELPVVLLHGMQESGESWSSWLPSLAERDVLIVDLPGHGRSAPPGPDYEWTIVSLAANVRAELDAHAIDSFHLVAAKLAGAIAVELAASTPGRVRSLTLAGAPLSTRNPSGSVDLRSNAELQAQSGTESFIRATQQARLGSDASSELIARMEAIMAATDPDSALAVARLAAEGVDVTNRLPGLGVPTLVLAASDSPLLPLPTVEGWVAAMPDARLVVIRSDAYHIAAARPHECVAATVQFIEDCDRRC